MCGVILTVKVSVPDEVTNAGDKATQTWLKEYFYELAGSNDGSEFLANLEINDSTVSVSEKYN